MIETRSSPRLGDAYGSDPTTSDGPSHKPTRMTVPRPLHPPKPVQRHKPQPRHLSRTRPHLTAVPSLPQTAPAPEPDQPLRHVAAANPHNRPSAAPATRPVRRPPSPLLPPLPLRRPRPLRARAIRTAGRLRIRTLRPPRPLRADAHTDLDRRQSPLLRLDRPRDRLTAHHVPRARLVSPPGLPLDLTAPVGHLTFRPPCARPHPALRTILNAGSHPRPPPPLRPPHTTPTAPGVGPHPLNPHRLLVPPRPHPAGTGDQQRPPTHIRDRPLHPATPPIAPIAHIAPDASRHLPSTQSPPPPLRPDQLAHEHTPREHRRHRHHSDQGHQPTHSATTPQHRRRQ
ncbi:hypothetical protein SAMN05421505_1129 [Sinosporangium album]|uniref:Uncharacterized protein n=1 Tax=Sinosporangium album TaxID=504805 RepID=A0A1G8A484_9ACTN|nr:hypothetical protein SAMN05421505_1129 [Sinosporangium album]